MNEINKIAVIGGGNIGTQFACVAAAKGYIVNVYTSTPEVYTGELYVIGDTPEQSYTGKPALVTNDIADALKECDLVFVTFPAFMFEKLDEMMAQHIPEKACLCILPGTGGAEYAFQRCLKKGVVLAGLQRVPGVARLLKKGESVSVKGIRSELFVASIPTSCAPEIADVISGLFGIPCNILPNYLSVTLTPSNPILHTSRLCSMFIDYEDGKYYDHNILFYEEWNDNASKLLLACDDELQTMCHYIEDVCGLNLQDVRSLRQHYESDTPEKLTQKIRSIKSFEGLGSPMLETEQGWVPDFANCYFSADFAHGLSIIEELSKTLGFDCPSICFVMDWYRKQTGYAKYSGLENNGVISVEDVKQMYLR